MRLILALSLLAVLGFVAAPVLAQQDSPNATGITHEGIIVSVTGDKLVCKGTGLDSTEHSFTVPTDTTIMLDGKTAMLSDLKPGQKIRVTKKTGDRTQLTKIEALDKNTDFDRSR
jgi:large exoprotein involved in heme utilization and adhesion